MNPTKHPTTGKVYLVGAGPGDPELLTVKAARILALADVVLYDALVSAEILSFLPKHALRVDVGKRCGTKLLTQEDINALLIVHANSAKVVVRLKGGDPGIFGRGGEEIDALLAAGADFEIVPGVTSALAAAAGARISLTDRRLASNLLITTLQRRAGHTGLGIDRVPPNTTVAVYMPGGDYAYIADSLHAAGVSPEVPCAVIASASTQAQQVLVTTVGALAGAAGLAAPSVLIVGHVVSSSSFVAEAEEWRDQVAAHFSEPQVCIRAT